MTDRPQKPISIAITTEQAVWKDYMVGSSTAWANLPTPMEFKLRVPYDANLLVTAQFSRVQHSHGSINTAFRILVDGNEVATTNIGNSHGWGYDHISFQGLRGISKGHTHVEVQYKTQGGSIAWYNDANGAQERRLIAVALPR